MLYPFLLFSLCVYPKNSPLRSLRQGTYIGLRFLGTSSPPFYMKVSGFNLFLLHTATAHFFTFAFPLHCLLYSSAFSFCSCNPSGVSDIPTKSSANTNPDTVSSFPIVNPYFAASTAINTTIMSLLSCHLLSCHHYHVITIMSLLSCHYHHVIHIYTLNRLGDSVYPGASPCTLSTHSDISPSSITAPSCHASLPTGERSS